MPHGTRIFKATCRRAQRAIGVLAADLAAAGFEGPKHILEGQHGWLTATGSLPSAAHAMKGLSPSPNAPWLIHEVSFKPWPVCRHVHPAIACAIQLHKQISLVSDVAEIEISTYQTAIDFANQAHPSDSQQARFSLQHAVAVALWRGDFWLTDTEAESLHLPELVRLRQCTKVRAHQRWTQADPAHYGAQVKVWLSNGQCREAVLSDAPGDPENPLSVADILAKNERVMKAANLKIASCQATDQCLYFIAHGPFNGGFVACFAKHSHTLNKQLISREYKQMSENVYGSYDGACWHWHRKKHFHDTWPIGKHFCRLGLGVACHWNSLLLGRCVLHSALFFDRNCRAVDGFHLHRDSRQ
jgi:hypothetical protein